MKITRTRDVEWVDAMDHGHFRGRRKPLGGQKLTSGLWELPPGKKSFPMHLHHVTEEALYAISGQAKLRVAGENGPVEHELGPGDYVSFPPGGPAHQLFNHGSEPFLYLAMSATQGYDLVEYPDSGKVAATAGAFPTGKRFIFRQKDQADYWDGEE